VQNVKHFFYEYLFPGVNIYSLGNLHKNLKKVGNCAGLPIPGKKFFRFLCKLPIDFFGGVWYNGISARLGRGRAAEYLFTQMYRNSK
jgi:hypothetical protein